MFAFDIDGILLDVSSNDDIFVFTLPFYYSKPQYTHTHTHGHRSHNAKLLERIEHSGSR